MTDYLVPDSNDLGLHFEIPRSGGNISISQKVSEALEEAYTNGFIGCFINNSDQPSWARKIAAASPVASGMWKPAV